MTSQAEIFNNILIRRDIFSWIQIPVQFKNFILILISACRFSDMSQKIQN